MKKTGMAVLLLGLIIGNIGAIDTESYQFINRLLDIPAPGEPEIFEDGVIFTASALNRRVGIAFAHEGFSRVYWFSRLLVPEDTGPVETTEKKPKPKPVVYREAGILFYVYTPPEDIRELAYRLVIDGLWSVDPLNSRQGRGAGGMSCSVVPLPSKPRTPAVQSSPPGFINFSYNAPPGELITVAGNFNGWDPFMYELKETSPGVYFLPLSLPPGTYQYVFYHRGERVLDPGNLNRVYTREGKTASEAVVR